MRNNRIVKIDSETHKKLMEQKRQLSVIENKDIPAGEIIKRTLSGPDIPERLRLGSKLRRGR